MTATTSTPRVAKLRQDRATRGLPRWELSPPPHPDDRAAILAFAQKLARRRERVAKCGLNVRAKTGATVLRDDSA